MDDVTSSLYCYLGGLALEGGGQGVGEEPEVDWEEELHEGDDDKDGEGNHSKDVSSRPAKLEGMKEWKINRSILTKAAQALLSRH